MKAVLIDISGTLVVNNPGLENNFKDSLLKLIDAKLPFKLLSNSSKQSHSDVFNDISTRFPIGLSPNDLMTPLSSCKNHITQNHLNPLLLLTDSAIKDFEGVYDDSKPFDSVVVGLAPQKFNYSHLNHAFKILKHNPHSQLIATHSSLYFQDKDNDLSLGPGPFIHALQSATGKNPFICGKPSTSFFINALNSMGVQESDYKDVAIVGDDALSDLGVDLPIQKILVKTGKYREGDESKVNGLHALHDSFSHFVNTMI